MCFGTVGGKEWRRRKGEEEGKEGGGLPMPPPLSLPAFLLPKLLCLPSPSLGTLPPPPRASAVSAAFFGQSPHLPSSPLPQSACIQIWWVDTRLVWVVVLNLLSSHVWLFVKSLHLYRTLAKEEGENFRKAGSCTCWQLTTL